MSRILITGATGFVGRAVIRALRADGHTLSGTTRQADLAQGSGGVPLYRMPDFSESMDWTRIVAGADVVVHLAAAVGVGHEALREVAAQLLGRAARGVGEVHQHVPGTGLVARLLAQLPLAADDGRRVIGVHHAAGNLQLDGVRAVPVLLHHHQLLVRRDGDDVDPAPRIEDEEVMLRARARRMWQQHGIKLFVIDYLQLMTSGRKVESRQLEVSEFSRSLKLLAKELDVPVIAISQLNRGAEQRQDKRPLLADLRESGSLEQDADMVILLHREDAYERESPRAGEADFIVAKHRNGPTDTVTVAFQGHYSRFVDMAQQ